MWRLQQQGLIPPDSCPRGDTKQFSSEGIVKALTISEIPTPCNGVLSEKLMVAETYSYVLAAWLISFTLNDQLDEGVCLSTTMASRFPFSESGPVSVFRYIFGEGFCWESLLYCYRNNADGFPLRGTEVSAL
jgi:hypothetical protein